MFKPTIFREYDIRGIADVELLDADVEQLGRAFGTYLRRHAGSKINLGRDTRLSSPRLRDALMRGLKASGCQVTDLGVVAHARALLLGLPPQGRWRRDDHRQPQSERVQRFQDGLRRLHDSRRGDPGDPPPDRQPAILKRGEGTETTADLVTPTSTKSPPSSTSRGA